MQLNGFSCLKCKNSNTKLVEKRVVSRIIITKLTLENIFLITVLRSKQTI